MVIAQKMWRKLNFIGNNWLSHQVISGKHGQFYARNRFNHYDKKVSCDFKTPCLHHWLNHRQQQTRENSSFQGSYVYILSLSVPEKVVLCSQLWAAHAKGENCQLQSFKIVSNTNCGIRKYKIFALWQVYEEISLSDHFLHLYGPSMMAKVRKLNSNKKNCRPQCKSLDNNPFPRCIKYFPCIPFNVVLDT